MVTPMPVSLPIPVRRLSQPDFAEIAYEVMRYVFAIHNEIGRFFDEKIYKRELAHRLAGVRLEVPIDIAFDSFRKQYFIDVLGADGALFEFKAVDVLTGRHRAQLLQYLMLCGLAHGKLINVRTVDVEHEFVNTSWEHADRVRFAVRVRDWNTSLPGVSRLQDVFVPFLRDLGAGLEIPLYEEALTHFFGGPEQVEANVAVGIDGHSLGHQCVRLIGAGVAFKITAFDDDLRPFEVHARRLLDHMDLRAIAWANVNMQTVTFTTLER
jgi:GxxExxY protein